MPIDDEKTNPLAEQEDYDVPVFVSPFLDSLLRGSVRIVKSMIERGERDVNSPVIGGTAGHIAASQGDYRMLKMLLFHGLDLTIKDEGGEGKTVLQIIEELRVEEPRMQQVLDEHMERLKLQEKSESEVIDASSSIGSAAQSTASSGSVKTLQTPLRDIISKHAEKPIKEDHLASADELDSNKSGVTGRWSGSHTSDLS